MTAHGAPLTGLVLAGGRSRRMGFDKSRLELCGVPLWRRQWEVLMEVGVEEVYLAGPEDGPWEGSGLEVLNDLWEGGGPLAGVGAGLRRARGGLLVVLAVDLPAIQAEFLRRLVERCDAGRGVVCRVAEGGWEPLAAVYPVSGLELLEAQARDGCFSMQEFVRRLVKIGMCMALEVEPADALQFTNLNYPHEIGGAGVHFPS